MYGYKIINGRAEIDEAEAAVIIDIFNGYISGLSMKSAAESAGVPMAHSKVKKLLSRTAYIGDEYYPPIISRETPLQKQMPGEYIAPICITEKSGIVRRRGARSSPFPNLQSSSMIRQSKPNTYIV